MPFLIFGWALIGIHGIGDLIVNVPNIMTDFPQIAQVSSQPFTAGGRPV